MDIIIDEKTAELLKLIAETPSEDLLKVLEEVGYFEEGSSDEFRKFMKECGLEDSVEAQEILKEFEEFERQEK